MKTSLDLRSTILGAIIGGVAALTIAATTDTGATRWEYSVQLQYFKVRDPEYDKIHATQLNTLAAQGWEVVCSHTIDPSPDPASLGGTREVVLKRAKK
jgi:hypothetical protein